MIGVTFPGEREIEFVEFPDPVAAAGEVVIEIKASGICGSDLHAFRAPKDQAAFADMMKGMAIATMRDNGPLIMGHEPGRVVEVGIGVAPSEAKLGDRIMVHHYWGCAVCGDCRSGWTQMCQREAPQVYGINAHGAHRKDMRIPARTLVQLPDELSFEAGASIACGTGTAFAALKRLRMSGGDAIAIFGQGPVGLSATQFAVAMGARVIALDINDERLQRAQEFGADAVVNPSKTDAVAAIRDLTHGLGVPCSLETSGARDARIDVLRCLRIWGTAGYVGIGGPVPFNLNGDLIARQINVFGSLTFSTVLQAECAAFAVEKKIPIDAIFSDRWQLDQAVAAYKAMDSQTGGKGVFLI